MRDHFTNCIRSRLQPQKNRLRLALIAAVIATTLALPPLIAAQSAPPAGDRTATVLTAAQMRSDLGLFKDALTKLHPGTYRYISPRELDREFESAMQRVSAPLPESEFLILVSQLATTIRCGHTYVNPYNQKKALKARLFEGRTYLPFYFDVVGKRFIISASAVPDLSVDGAEIERINGFRTAAIIERLMTVAKGDGLGTDEHRRASIGLERADAERFALFDWYFPLFFPIAGDVFAVDLRDPLTGKRRSVSVQAMTKSERTEAMAARYGASPSYDDGWAFEIRNDGVGYLRISNSITWRLTRIKFESFLAEAFAELRAKGTRHLIIDIRGNGGGDTAVGYELSRYLAVRRLGRYADALRLVRNVSALPDLAPHLDTYSDELANAVRSGTSGSSYRRYDAESFEITNGFAYPHVEPYPNNFTGRTFVIQDALNASASFQLLDFLKENRLATLVGQTSGGSRQGINGGNYYFLTLPGSGIEIDIPVYFQAPRSMRKDGPIEPDIKVVRSPTDRIRKVDRELETVLQMIKRERPKG